MHIADQLSRPVDSIRSSEHMEESDLVERYVCSYVRESLNNEGQESELVAALHADPVARACVSHIQQDWSSFVVKDACVELLKLFGSKERLTVWGNIILFDARVYVPVKLRRLYLRRCHEGHQGIDKCRRRSRQLFWWPTVSTDIENFINSCEVCIKRGQIKHQPAVEQPLPESPWDEIAVDLFTFGGDCYLIAVDYYSKWIETAKLADQSALSVVKALKTVFSRFGIPSRIRCDNGLCFDSTVMRDFAKTWGFAHDTSSPRYPQSNGLAERAVGIVKRLWSSGDDWDSALLAYRTTLLRCGYSPSQLLFGRPIRSSLGLPLEGSVDYDSYEE